MLDKIKAANLEKHTSRLKQSVVKHEKFQVLKDHPLMNSKGNLLKCEPCRDRRDKCGHEYPGPCGPCVSKGIEEKCHYVKENMQGERYKNEQSVKDYERFQAQKDHPLMSSSGRLLHCEPCRSRKVPCDNEQPGPCGTCVSENRQDLCYYVLESGIVLSVSKRRITNKVSNRPTGIRDYYTKPPNRKKS